jgi:hypothetical protein
MLASRENLGLMLADTRHPFGHGYCLAACLQGWGVADLTPPAEAH